MPEGPELHLAARIVNQVGMKYQFGGAIVKSEVSTKNPDVSWSADRFTIKAEARGKELNLVLADAQDKGRKTSILFRFGMSGSFQLCEADDLPKHAHLRLFTEGVQPRMALCFVDYRRFGRWFVEADWGEDRGPDPMFEYEDFRKNILENLKKAAFNRPICEALLNQKFFNGIGNYLRAEILYRARIKPFDQAREVLECLVDGKENREAPDFLKLCSTVPKEVLALNSGMGFDAKFLNGWMRCYTVRGMNNLVDSNKRTIWFSGPPGSMVPKNAKTRGRESTKNTKKLKSNEVEEVDIENEQMTMGLFNGIINEQIEPSNGITDEQMMMIAIGLSNINFQESFKASESNRISSEVVRIYNPFPTANKKKSKSTSDDVFLISSDSEEDAEGSHKKDKLLMSKLDAVREVSSKKDKLRSELDVVCEDAIKKDELLGTESDAVLEVSSRVSKKNELLTSEPDAAGEVSSKKDEFLMSDAASSVQVKRKAGGKPGNRGGGCHLCGHPIPRVDKKKKCYCSKMVHKGCFEAEGESCQSHKQ